MIVFIALTFAAFLSSCASSPTTADGGGSSVTMVYVAERSLEFEPCGCAFTPLGGFIREQNLVSRWNGEDYVHLSSGNTFVPKKPDSLSTDKTTQRRTLFAEALKKLKLRVLSVSPADLELGTAELKRLEDVSGARFISTNLYDPKTKKPMLPTHVTVEAKSTPLVVLGVSRKDKGKGIEVRDPEASIREALSKVEKKDVLVVLLSTLSEKENEKLLSQFEDLHIVFSTHPTVTNFRTRQTGKKQLLIASDLEGRIVNQLKVHWKAIGTAFFSPLESTFLLENRRWWYEQTQLHQGKSFLEKKKSAKLKHEKEREKYMKLLRDTDMIPTKESPTTITYEPSLFRLDSSYDKPAENEMTEIVRSLSAISPPKPKNQ